MGTLQIYVGEWSLVVPFTRDGLEVAKKFIDMLGLILKDLEAEGSR